MTDDMQGLARVLRAAWEKHESSYVRSVYDEDGRPEVYGYYGITMRDAVQAAIDESTLGDGWLMPAQLMMSWPNDALTWAAEVLNQA